MQLIIAVTFRWIRCYINLIEFKLPIVRLFVYSGENTIEHLRIVRYGFTTSFNVIQTT